MQQLTLPGHNTGAVVRAFLAGVAVLLLASVAAAAPCVVPDNGADTVDLPPAGCEYRGDTASDLYVIVDGLPLGTTIEMDPIHKNWICGNPIGTCSVPVVPGVCEAPGGSLGGTVACATAEVELDVSGTGTLSTFARTLTIQLDWEEHHGPRNPGDPVQPFSARVFRMDGQIFGDPDFCVIRLLAGDQFGLPSTGSTVLTQLPASDWNVDSFFDVAYQVEFQGCPGSVLEGFGGVTTGSLRIRTGEVSPAAPVPALSQVIAGALVAVLLLLGAGMLVRRRAAV
jgi:hypothetical protein